MPRPKLFTDEERRERKKEQDKASYHKNKDKHKKCHRRYHQSEEGKKSCKISDWKKSCLIVDNYDEIYYRWLNSEKCEMCGKEYVMTKRGFLDKCMEHNHITGEFRSICCMSCNSKMMHKDRKKEKENN